MKTHKAFRLLAIMAMALLASGQVASGEEKDIVETAVSAGSFKTLAAALQAGELVAALQGEGPFTVFAPTDDAFAALPEGVLANLLKPENKDQLVGILKFHVVQGHVPAAKVIKLAGAKTLNGQRVDIKIADGKVTVDGARVEKADIRCSNGVIHVIDRVILPAADNIPNTAEKAGKFSTLIAALKAAGLTEALSGEGPFTVFAPTDEAFSKLPGGTVESLLKPENRDKLIGILKYHVVPGRIYSEDALAAKSAKTLQGQAVQIAVRGGQPMVNDARLIATDVDATNGVIHVIDSVLLPVEAEKVSALQR
jgi:transforming growth factor-beta-induced protein